MFEYLIFLFTNLLVGLLGAFLQLWISMVFILLGFSFIYIPINVIFEIDIKEQKNFLSLFCLIFFYLIILSTHITVFAGSWVINDIISDDMPEHVYDITYGWIENSINSQWLFYFVSGFMSGIYNILLAIIAGGGLILLLTLDKFSFDDKYPTISLVLSTAIIILYYGYYGYISPFWFIGYG